MKKVFNLHATDEIRVALMKSTYNGLFDATSQSWSDISSYEITAGGGYDAGGAIMTTTVDGTTSTAKFLTDGDVTWSNATITAYGAVIYDVTAGNKLIAWLYFGGAQSSSSGNFTVSWTSSSEVIVSIT